MLFYQRRYWENISILYQYYHSMIWDCYVKGNLITWKFRYPKKKKSYTNCQTRYMYSFFPFQFCTWVWFGRNVVTFFCHLLVRYIHVDLLTTWTSVSCKKKTCGWKFHPHVNIIFWQVAKKINKIISQVNLNFWRINISTTDIWQVVGWNMPLYQGWGILCRNGVGRSTDPVCYWIVSTRQSISSECRVARKCFDWWILCYYLLW